VILLLRRGSQPRQDFKYDSTIRSSLATDIEGETMRRVSAAALFLAFTLLASCVRHQSLHDTFAAEPPFLYKNDHFLDQIESGVNRMARLAGTRPNWVLNKPYSPRATNLYIIDLRNVGNDQVARLAPELQALIGSLRDNAIAVPPDIVVMDMSLVGKILENSYADLMMLLQEPGNTPAMAKILDILSDYHRIRTTRLNMNLVDDRDREWIEGGYGGKRVFWPVVIEKIDQAGLGALFSAALMPVLFHEQGHLEHGDSGGHMLPDLAELKRRGKALSHELSNQLWNGRIKAAEDAADKYSYEMLARYMSKDRTVPADAGIPVNEWIGSHPLGPNPEFYQKLLTNSVAFLLDKSHEAGGEDLERLLVASTGKYFRDEVLTEAFHDFRGLAAENNLIRFSHRNCDINQPKPTPVDFGGVDDLTGAERGFYPVMTRDDWTSIRSRFFEHVEAGTHAHNFYRASAILSAAQNSSPQDAERAFSLDKGAALFAALMEDDPTKLEPTFVRSTRIPVQRLLAGLDESMVFEDAINCARSKCRVGRFRHDNELGVASTAFLELVSDARDNVVFARFAFPLFTIPVGEWNTAPPQQGFARQMLEFITSLRFVANAFGEDIRKSRIGVDAKGRDDSKAAQLTDDVIHHPRTPVERFLRFRSTVRQCNAATERLEGPDDFVLEMRSLSLDRWIGIEILPSIQSARH
jgi:hypothetical protein